MRPPLHPKIASSCATVAPALAARVAAILRTPCAEPGTPAAQHAILKSLLKTLLWHRMTTRAADKREISTRSGG